MGTVSLISVRKWAVKISGAGLPLKAFTGENMAWSKSAAMRREEEEEDVEEEEEDVVKPTILLWLSSNLLSSKAMSCQSEPVQSNVTKSASPTAKDLPK